MALANARSLFLLPHGTGKRRGTRGTGSWVALIDGAMICSLPVRGGWRRSRRERSVSFFVVCIRVADKTKIDLTPDPFPHGKGNYGRGRAPSAQRPAFPGGKGNYGCEICE
jgi:hypothetical protein